MQTITIRGETLSAADAARVAAAAGGGGVIVFPTESFYALGADPFNPDALERVYSLKGRPAGRPLLVLIDGAGEIPRFARQIPVGFQALMARFWPGPLTLLFPARPELPEGIVSPEGRVALRIPGSSLCRRVLRAAGGALTGTSANRAGQPPSPRPQEAAQPFAEGVILLVDGGTLPGGKVSTILMLDEGRPAVLREGAVSSSEIDEFHRYNKERGREG